MDIPREKEALRDLPIREDGTTGINEMTGHQLEAMADQVTGWQADELCGEGNRSRGCRKRRPAATVGEITLRIPKLREGTYFPDELIRPYSRVDRAMVGVVREVYVRGPSARRTGKAAEALGFASLSPSRVSRTAAGLDGEVAAPGARRFGGMAFPCPWPGAAYPDCRDEGHARPGGVAAAIACGGDGSRRLVGLGVVDTEPSSPRKAPPRGLRGRGVSGARRVVSDDHGGLARAIAEVSRGAARQRRVARPGRDVASWFPKREDKAVATAAMRAVLAERDPRPVRAACRQATERMARPEPRAGEPPGDAEANALAYLDLPHGRHIRLRTNNVQERANEETRRRAKVINVFPSVESMMRLVGSVLIDADEGWLGTNFIDATSPEGVTRSQGEPQPISDDVMERARICVMAATGKSLREAA